jgi:hypothetical protein
LFQRKTLTEELMILKRLIFVVFAAVLGGWWSPARLEAQTMTTGSVRGVVTNPKNAVVPNAEVLLTNNAKGTIQTVRTSLSGTYQFGLLDPGSYTLTVTYTGFQQQTKIVTVPLGEPVTVDFQLSLQPQGPVRAVGASMLHKENGNVGITLSRLEATQIPDPGNDLTYLAQFSPGTVMNTSGGGTGNFSNYGMPATSNRFSVDGFDEMQPFLNVNYAGATKNMLGTNEIQDVSIVSNGYTGTYGEFAGTGVDYVTESGGNSLHGNATYFWNQRFLNANNFFNNEMDTPRPFDGQNQWQGSVGGPLRKDKVFFYVDTEGLRVLVPSTSTVVMPSPDFQAATITNLGPTMLDEPNVANWYQSSLFSLFNNAPDEVYALDNQPPGSTTDPQTHQTVLTGDGCGSFNENPLFYSTGAEPCAVSFSSSQSSLTTEWMVDSRIDINVNAKDRLAARMQFDGGKQATYTDPISNIFNVSSNQPEKLGQLEWTHDFGPSAANQFLVGTQFYSEVLGRPGPSSTTVSFPTTVVMSDGTFFSTGSQNPCANPPIGNGTPIFIGGENCDLPQGQTTTDFEVSDDFSKVIGGNTIKMGGLFRRLDIGDHDFGALESGLLTIDSINTLYDGGEPGDSLTQSFPQSLDEPIAYYTSGGYIEDDWRFSKTLSLTFAFRMEHDSNPICRHLCFAQLAEPFSDISENETSEVESALEENTPYNDAANNNPSNYPNMVPNAGIKLNQLQALTGFQKILYEPRFSFAWQPFGPASKTVVRGGAGIFYNLFPPQIADYMAENAPLDATFTFTNDYFVPNAAAGGGPNIFNDVAEANAAFQNGFYSNYTEQQIAANSNGTFGPGISLPSLFTTESTTRMPQYQKWSLELQHQFGPTTSVTLSYVGNHGVHEPVIDTSANAYLIGDLTDITAAPDPRFGEVTVLYSGGNSNYNGGTISVAHHMNGLWGAGVIQGSYTYSRALDEVSNGGFATFSPTSLLNPQDPINTQGSYGPADYDVPQEGNVNAVWDLPLRQMLGKRGSSALLDGWQLSGTFIAHSGFPYSVIDSTQSEALQSTNNYYGELLPTFTGGATSCEMTPYGPGCLAPPGTAIPQGCTAQNAAACEFSPNTTFPGGERNMFRGPIFMNFDAALMKQTRLSFWEGARLGIGVQVYNVLNHPNFGQPVNNWGSSDFGEILNTVSSPTSIYGSFLGGDGSPRLIQFKAQFTF